MGFQEFPHLASDFKYIDNMDRLRLLTYRASAIAVELAQAVVQIFGGGNGDPGRLDEKAKTKRT